MSTFQNKRTSQPARAEESDRASFLEWARKSLVPQPCGHDLDDFGKIVGDTPLVALTEAVHGAAEPLDFRNQVFQYLVERKGFTAIAIESGIVEGRIVNAYVRGGQGEQESVLRRGISWTFDRLPQNRALVQWLRAYNSDPRHHRKISFYGFDLSGSPGERGPSRGINTALKHALVYLRSVDAPAAAVYRARFRGLWSRLRFDFSGSNSGYECLGQDSRDVLTSGISDLVSLMERREAAYTEATSESDYEWAHRAVVDARQADSWLRQIPIGWKRADSADDMVFAGASADVRDRAQADNFDWIVKREGHGAKILVFGHRYHLSSFPVRANWMGLQSRAVMGTYLKRRYGTRLVTVGNFVGKGEVECAGTRCCDGTKQLLAKAPRGSFEVVAGEIGERRFLLDLRGAPPQVAKWLDQMRPLGRGTPGRGNDVLETAVGQAFDVLLYLDAVTPVCCAR